MPTYHGHFLTWLLIIIIENYHRPFTSDDTMYDRSVTKLRSFCKSVMSTSLLV